MTHEAPTLHLLCGKIASGKSTFAQRLAQDSQSVLISEDDWLAALYPDEMKTLSDYGRYSERVKKVLAPHIVSLLRAGVSVILDFPANTVQYRAWMKGIFTTANVAHQLHIFNTPDEICLDRLRKRNASQKHPFEVTEKHFQAISAYFVLPSDEEGFDVNWHVADEIT